MPLPTPRGPLSSALVADLRAGRLRPSTLALTDQAAASPVPLADEDLQIALYTCYELHYRGFDDAGDHWEWDPQLLGLRAVLEAPFEAALRDAAAPWTRSFAREGDPVDRQLAAMVAADDGPSMSEHMAKRADEVQWSEFLVLRSAYHLKEADPHTWAIPRIAGRAKAALVEIQADEYGGGSHRRMHSVLFARVMRAFGLDDTHGAHIDAVPAEQLATLNAMTLLGLHRRLRGAVVGHLAALEMTSTVPSRRYASGLRRLGKGEDATLFYDEHVEADAVHEQVASVDMCGSLVADEPALHADVLFGAAVALELEARAGAVAAGVVRRSVSPPQHHRRRRRLRGHRGARTAAPSVGPSARRSPPACGCRRRTVSDRTCRTGTGPRCPGPGRSGCRRRPAAGSPRGRRGVRRGRA